MESQDNINKSYYNAHHAARNKEVEGNDNRMTGLEE